MRDEHKGNKSRCIFRLSKHRSLFCFFFHFFVAYYEYFSRVTGYCLLLVLLQFPIDGLPVWPKSILTTSSGNKSRDERPVIRLMQIDINKLRIFRQNRTFLSPLLFNIYIIYYNLKKYIAFLIFQLLYIICNIRVLISVINS